MTAVVGFNLVASSLFGSFLIDKLGRRAILLLGDVVCLVALLGLSLLTSLSPESDDLITLLIMIFVFGFSISLGPIVWSYIAEILPAKGNVITTIFNLLLCSSSGLIFPMQLRDLKIEGCFILHLAISTVLFLVILVFVKETKGKSTKEINDMFEGKYH